LFLQHKMTDKVTEAKDKGNEAFKAQRYEEAIKWFSEGLKLDPNNHVLLSNRSACYVKTGKLQEALDDANKVIALKPDWARGYSRKGAALHAMERYEEAKEAYKKALELEPNNEQIKQSLQEVTELAAAERKFNVEAMEFVKKMMSVFQGDVLSKVRAIPETAEYAKQPDFVAKILEIQKNPQALLQHIQTDERIKKFLLLAVERESVPSGSAPTEHEHTASPMDTEDESTSKDEKKEETKPKAKPTPESTDPNVLQSEELKEKGNAAYKQRKFEEALSLYSQAFELNPKNMLLLTNKAAVYFEMGKYEDCIKECERAIEVGEANRADFKHLARAYTRMGNAYMKLEKFAEAVKAFDKALTNHRNAETLALKQKAEKMKEEKERKEYINPELSVKAKEEGNAFFKKGDFPAAVKSYTEAIKRNPNDPVNYSNRAAAYTKLMAYREAIRDCDEALKLDPKFVKAYIRKGHAYFMLKDYPKCLETYEEGLKIDPNNAELQQGLNQCLAAINERHQTASEKEVLEKAMQDPEIRGILMDPAMQQILKDISSDPKAAAYHLQNAEVRKKIEKLIAAGIVSTK
jgi:stress-induced-phosphoprotein 1